ncbi:MAG: RNA ligase family protein [Planctomycetota bacterium]
MKQQILKYPRTRHIVGSRAQPGDEDLTDEPFASLAGRHLVVEEKIDGANAAISFNAEGILQLQSRGHYLTGGPRERHFALFKTWATTHSRELWSRLGTRYVAFGEWVYAKHTIFYDSLPHYFLEFDLFDRDVGTFVTTKQRREFFSESPIVSVPVLFEGCLSAATDLPRLIQRSLYKTVDWRSRLVEAADDAAVAVDRVQQETDRSDAAEGLYIKVEEAGQVAARYKFVRHSFLTSVVDSGSHWLTRPIVENRLADGVDIFGAAI